MGDQTQAYDIFQAPLSSGYPLPLIIEIRAPDPFLTGLQDSGS